MTEIFTILQRDREMKTTPHYTFKGNEVVIIDYDKLDGRKELDSAGRYALILRSEARETDDIKATYTAAYISGDVDNGKEIASGEMINFENEQDLIDCFDTVENLQDEQIIINRTRTTKFFNWGASGNDARIGEWDYTELEAFLAKNKEPDVELSPDLSNAAYIKMWLDERYDYLYNADKLQEEDWDDDDNEIIVDTGAYIEWQNVNAKYEAEHKDDEI